MRDMPETREQEQTHERQNDRQTTNRDKSTTTGKRDYKEGQIRDKYETK